MDLDYPIQKNVFSDIKMHLKIDFENDLLKKIGKNLKDLHNTHTEWGWINENVYPSSDIAGRKGIKIAEIAKINEYGGFSKSKTGAQPTYIPPRPYFRQALMSTESRFISDVSKIFKAALHNTPYHQLLEDQARLAAWDIISSIKKQNMKPLAQKTIDIKGNSIQWIDTGVMMSNIGFKVYKTNIDRAKGVTP